MEEKWERKAKIVATYAAKNPKRTRQQKWDAAHIKTASCRLTSTEMEDFKKCCKSQKITRYQAIRYMIKVFTATIKREKEGKYEN